MASESQLTRHQFAAVSMLLGLAAGLLFFRLDFKSLWLDEALSIALVRQGWEAMFKTIAENEVHMSLYFMLLKLWTRIGDSELVLRSLSALFALATVPVTFALGARLFNRSAGFIAALLLAVNSFFIRYGQEARSYSLVLLLVCVSSYLFVSCIERPSRRSWSAYITISVLAVYAHFFAALVLLSHAVSLIFRRSRDIPWSGLLVSWGAFGLGSIPLVLAIGNRGEAGISWIPQPDLRSIYNLFLMLTGKGGDLLLLVYFVPCLIFFCAAVRTWISTGRSVDSWRYALLLAWLFVPIATVFAYSFVTPLFWPRFFIICLVPLVMIASSGLSRLRYRWLTMAALLLLLALSSRPLFDWYSRSDKEGGEDWRSATSYLLSEAKSEDLFFFYPGYAAFPVAYYLYTLDHPEGVPEALLQATEAYVDGTLQHGHWPVPEPSFLDRHAAKHDRIWLIARNLRQIRNQPGIVIVDSLASRHELLQSRQFAKISVLLYELSSERSSGQDGPPQEGPG